MECKYCKSVKLVKRGSNNGKQNYQCKDCGKYFSQGEVQNKYEYISYFNVKLRNDNCKLTRENYCIPPDKIDSSDRHMIKKYGPIYEQYEKYKEKVNFSNEYKKTIEYINLFCRIYVDIPNEKFADKEHYTETFKNKQYEDCMKNFDLNMKYFSKIDQKDFNEYVEKFVKVNKFIKIEDLNILKDKPGIYMMVLDEYKQVYIGTSDNVKSRILNHWRKKKEFTRLIYGNVNNSILSIDSFGALDTTRVYYKKTSDLYNEEKKFVDSFKKEYMLNRVKGGINAEDDEKIRNLQLLASRQKRILE